MHRRPRALRRSSLKIALVLLLVFLGSFLRAQPVFTHLGPVETLDNGSVTLQVALRVGRIVSFHRSGEPDWLVVHDEAPHPGWNWNPWGGDRMWPTAQDLNPQIYKNGGFDPVIDGQPWELLSKTAVSLEMRSGLSPRLGLRVTHRIELIGQTTEVLHTYRLEQLAQGGFPVHVWTVSGLRRPDFVLMESDPRVGHDGYKPFKFWPLTSTLAPDATLLPSTRILHVPIPAQTGTIKLGTYGRWIALVSGGSALCETVAYDPDLLYLETSNLQTFMDTQLGIYEIETLSPSWFLRPGDTRQWTVRWRLLDFPPAARTAATKAAFLQNALNAP